MEGDYNNTYYQDDGYVQTVGEEPKSLQDEENTYGFTSEPRATDTEHVVSDVQLKADAPTELDPTTWVDGADYYAQDNNYQQSQAAGYYYQGDDGMFYYTENPDTEMLNEAMDSAGVVPTPQNLVRSYEYEDWEPESYGWWADIIVDTFLSKQFRIYLTVLLYCGAVFLGVLGLNWSFTLLYRLYSPPNLDKNLDLQAFSYLAMFFYLSFIIASAFCVVIDMVWNLWTVKRSDRVFWGFSQSYFSKKKPPYVVYLIIILATVFFPVLFALIDTPIDKQSFVAVGQRYAQVATITVISLVAAVYVWFYWKALVYKRSAINNRATRDDFRLREKAYRKRPEKMTKNHWYHAEVVLEEFGMDAATLRSNCVLFCVGLVPIFALYAARTLDTYIGDPPVTWGAISSIAAICIFFIGWLTLLTRKNQWAFYVSAALIVLLLVLGLVGGGSGGEPVAVAPVIVMFVACHGMVTRKRKHELTRVELCRALQIPLNREMEQKKRRRRFDSYLCCCRDTLLNYIKCCVDVKTYFGYRHPDVRDAERAYALEHLALRTDQKVLLVWWLVVMFAVAFVIALANGVGYDFKVPVATASNTAVPAPLPEPQFCSLVYNRNGSAPLNVVDLALLSALSNSYSTIGDIDYATWFSQMPSLTRQYPESLPPNRDYATEGVNLRFSDYVDGSTNFHFITINTNARGLSPFRDVDEWGESLAFQSASAIAPLFTVWPEKFRAYFVEDASFLKKWFPNSTVSNNVEAYIQNLISQGLSDRMVLIGSEFSGGYAKLLSSTYNVSFVAFNAPGVRYKLPLLENGIQFVAQRNLWSYIDSTQDTATTFIMPCDKEFSSNKCGRIDVTINYLISTCGDRYGRAILDLDEVKKMKV